MDPLWRNTPATKSPERAQWRCSQEYGQETQDVVDPSRQVTPEPRGLRKVPLHSAWPSAKTPRVVGIGSVRDAPTQIGVGDAALAGRVPADCQAAGREPGNQKYEGCRTEATQRPERPSRSDHHCNRCYWCQIPHGLPPHKARGKRLEPCVHYLSDHGVGSHGPGDADHAREFLEQAWESVSPTPTRGNLAPRQRPTRAWSATDVRNGVLPFRWNSVSCERQRPPVGPSQTW